MRLMESDWNWISDQLFLVAIDIATQIRVDGGRKEAVTRYIYGQFLIKECTSTLLQLV